MKANQSRARASSGETVPSPATNGKVINQQPDREKYIRPLPDAHRQLLARRRN
jgi:hypothetical protein